MTTLAFDVDGTPQPQGSLTQYNGHITSANRNLKPWRKRVAYAAMQAIETTGWETTDKPVAVILTFRLQRGKTVKRLMPTVKPDLDKLTRAVLDSLTTAGVYVDDAQVVWLNLSKTYAEGNFPIPGVHVSVSAVED